MHAPFALMIDYCLHISLQVGLQAEEAKPVIPGNSLCSGYTVSRALLADVICLIRGDRFMTVGLTRKSDLAVYYSANSRNL